MQGKFKNFLNSVLTGSSVSGELLNSRKVNVFLQYACFWALFLGIRFAVIYVYGNATPFWDQWDAEAVGLYKPFIDGTLGWKHLIATHNEHHIFLTRVLALALLYINKTWNPLLQMVVSAGLHVIALTLFNSLLTRVLGRENLPVLLAFSLVLFSVPYGWENILAGFQSQFYFVVLFSIASVWLIVIHGPFGIKWWAGIGCGVLAFLSLASGVFTFAASAFVGLMFYLIRVRKTNRQLLAVVFLFGLFICGVLLTPTLEHQAVYKAHSLGEFYHALKTVLGWPISGTVLASAFRNLPIAIFIIFIVWKRPSATDPKWFLFGLCVWSLSQVVSMAYGRANGIQSSRYKDLYAIPIFVNFACLISLAQIYISQWRNYTILAVYLWIAVVLVSLGFYAGRYLPRDLSWKRETGVAQEENTKNYVATSDLKYLKDKPEFYIPFPNPGRLAEIIELPGIREILPSNINGSIKLISTHIKPDTAFVVNGYYFTTPKLPDTAWGSYTEQGDKAMGDMSLQFTSNLINMKFGIPVSGYPVHDGIMLAINQNGKLTPLTIKNNPGESWGTAYGRITSKDFSIYIKDSSAAWGGWLAVGKPFILGRFDSATTRLLSHYYVFILIGVVIIIFWVSQTGLTYRKNAS
jgi:hypothetical protein